MLDRDRIFCSHDVSELGPIDTTDHNTGKRMWGDTVLSERLGVHLVAVFGLEQ